MPFREHAISEAWLNRRGFMSSVYAIIESLRRRWRFVPTPNALPSRRWSDPDSKEYTWEDWREEMHKKYPFRLWLQEDLPFWIRMNITHPIDDAFYWFRSNTYRKFHWLDLRNKEYGYKWGWIDRSEAIFVACFNLLKDFVEKEDPFEMINWDSDEDHQRVAKEIRELYTWWTAGRKAEQDNLLKLDRKEYAKESDRLEAKDDEMLDRLIKIRHHLWT